MTANRSSLTLLLALAAGAATIYLVRWYLNRVEGSMSGKAVATTPVVTAAANIAIAIKADTTMNSALRMLLAAMIRDRCEGSDRSWISA